MTAPINFPTIAPPQLIPPRRSQLDGFAEFLAALQSQRADRADRREQLDMQRRALDSNLEGDKLSRKKTERELEIAELGMQAEEVADRYAREATTTPGLDEAGVSEIMGRMLSTEDKKLAPYLTAAFGRQVSGHQKLLTDVAARQSAQSGARVSKATEDDKIATSRTDTSRSSVELDNAKLERTMRELQTQGFDAQRLSAAQEFARASALPWGVVSKQFGLPPVAGGLAPSFVFPQPDAKGGAAAAGSAAMGKQLRLANDAINALGGKGLSPASYAALNTGAWKTGIINALSSREQQELGTAYAAFIAPIQAVAVKGAASDSDVQRMQRAYVTLESDASSVKAQKSLIRTALAESWDADATADEMSTKFDSIIKEFKLSRNSPIVVPFTQMLDKLKKVERANKTLKTSGARDATAPGAHRKPDDPTVARLLPPSK